MATIRIERYTAAMRREWDGFVRTSKNGTFLFLRAYMDYHSDRFTDHSLLYRDDKGRLVAAMPANETREADGRKRLCSHQGLTYGGLLMAQGMHAQEVLEAFRVTVRYLESNGFNELFYKQIPHIYHRIPAEEDDYALWCCGAEQAVCNLASTVDYASWRRTSAEYCRRNALSRLLREGVTLNMEASPGDYWPMLEACLQERYGAAPVHTLAEMEMLQQAFPENIVCCMAESTSGEPLAGVLLFLCGQTVHMQYSAATEQGRQLGVQDMLNLSLVEHYAGVPEVRFFDFGTSNEEGGRRLNATLNRYKEGFGARGVTYRQWRLKITE